MGYHSAAGINSIGFYVVASLANSNIEFRELIHPVYDF